MLFRRENSIRSDACWLQRAEIGQRTAFGIETEFYQPNEPLAAEFVAGGRSKIAKIAPCGVTVSGGQTRLGSTKKRPAEAFL